MICVTFSNVIDLIIFADDTNIFCTADNIVDLCKQVSLERIKFHNWFTINNLSLNIRKTNFMVLCKKHLNNNCNVYINECKIERVYVAKFLGILIDIQEFCSIQKVKPLLHSEALSRLYSSIFHSHLSYCADLWGNCSKVYLLPMIKAQKWLLD